MVDMVSSLLAFLDILLITGDQAATSKTAGARILCLDDGGVRSYSSLLILCTLMRAVALRAASDRPVEPWQHFDLICGSGSGGLLALLLGRLRMVCVAFVK